MADPANPTRDDDAEASLLGSILADPSRLDEVANTVGREDFFSEAHRAVWDAIATARRTGQPIDDPVIIGTLLKAADVVQHPHAFVLNLQTRVPHAAHAAYYAKLVREAADRRCLHELSGDLKQSAHDPTTSVAEIAADVETKLHRILEHSASPVETAATVTLRVATALDSEIPSGIATGFDSLDRMLSGGPHPGNLIVIAARPSIGKTALACSLMESLARLGREILFATAEQSADELIERLLAMVSGVPAVCIRERRLTGEDQAAIVRASNEVASLPIAFDDCGRKTVQQIAATARLHKRRSGLDVLVVDYLQILQPDDPKVSREQQVATMSRGLKQLAREIDVPVLCLAQLNRAIEGRENKRPRLSDIRDSGSIEQDADIVAFLDRARTSEDGDPKKATLIVAKNRHGSVGDVPLTFSPPTMRFSPEDQF